VNTWTRSFPEARRTTGGRPLAEWLNPMPGHLCEVQWPG
jgi:hypothetical protein